MPLGLIVRSRPRVRLACVAVVGIVVGGCGAEQEAPRTTPADAPDYRLEVRNQNFYAVTTYLVRAGHRERLGQVDGKTTQTFAFDWPLTEVQVLFDFVGVIGCLRTESLPVVRGDDLLVIVLPGNHRRASQQLCDD